MSKSKKGRLTKPVKKIQEILAEHVENKDFAYKLNEVNLKFTLRTDVKNELEDFSKLMIRAVEDIRILLETKFKK